MLYFRLIKMSLFSILTTVTPNGEQKSVKHYQGHNFEAQVSNARFPCSAESSIFRPAAFSDFSLQTIRDNALLSALICLFLKNSSGRKEFTPPLLAIDAKQHQKYGTSSWRSQSALSDSLCVREEDKKYQNKLETE